MRMMSQIKAVAGKPLLGSRLTGRDCQGGAPRKPGGNDS